MEEKYNGLLIRENCRYYVKGQPGPRCVGDDYRCIDMWRCHDEADKEVLP